MERDTRKSERHSCSENGAAVTQDRMGNWVWCHAVQSGSCRGEFREESYAPMQPRASFVLTQYSSDTEGEGCMAGIHFLTSCGPGAVIPSLSGLAAPAASTTK